MRCLSSSGVTLHVRWYSQIVSPARAAALFAGSSDVSLGARVLEALRRAQARYSEFDVDDEAFIERLGALCEADLERLHGLALTDLWLAHAAGTGCSRAVEVFEHTVFGPRVEAIRKRFGDDTTVEDEAQALRLNLIADTEPLLLSFRGQGSLQGWVSVALGRAVARSRARRRRAVADGLETLDEILEDELDLSGLTERAEAKSILVAALREAVTSVDAQHRILLKLHICDGLVIDDLAQLLGVHRATASRRLERARRALADEVRSRIKGAHGLDSRQVDSLLRRVRSSFQSLMSTFLVD